MPPRRGAPRARTRTKQSGDDTRSLEVAEVTIEIEDLQSFTDSINILIHGPSGHGKTVLAGGAARDYRCVFLTTEKGVVSAKRAGSTAQIMRAPDWEHTMAGLAKADAKLGPEDWLIVDSGTKMQTLYIRWILQQANMQNSARDLDIPAIPDHQKWQNGFMRFTDRIIDAPYNSIFITTSMTVEDAEGETRVIPHILGKKGEISDYISSQFDAVLYYAVAPQKSRASAQTRYILAQPYPPYLAKDRYNALGRWQDVKEGDYTAMSDFIGMIQDSMKEGSNES
jgi:AAA domain